MRIARRRGAPSGADRAFSSTDAQKEIGGREGLATRGLPRYEPRTRYSVERRGSNGVAG